MRFVVGVEQRKWSNYKISILRFLMIGNDWETLAVWDLSIGRRVSRRIVIIHNYAMAFSFLTLIQIIILLFPPANYTWISRWKIPYKFLILSGFSAILLSIFFSEYYFSFQRMPSIQFFLLFLFISTIAQDVTAQTLRGFFCFFVFTVDLKLSVA